MPSERFNASRVTDRFLLGGGIVGEDEIDWLKGQGVTAIISVASGLDDLSSATANGLDSLYIPWLDDGTLKPAEDFRHALRFVLACDEARLKASKTLSSVYVHCAAGHNRSAILLTFLMAALLGVNADEAWRVVKAGRAVASAFDHPQYRQSVIAALATVRNHVSGDPEHRDPSAPSADVPVAEAAPAKAKKA